MRYCVYILLMFGSYVVHGKDSEDSIARRNDLVRAWYVPDYVPVQYAGNLGWLSAGVGFATRKDNFQQSLIYGYTPARVSGIRLHTVSAKSIFHLYRHDLNFRNSLIPYAALSVSLDVAGNSFFTLPDNMPDGYYHFPKSIHAIPAIGVKHRHLNGRLKGVKGLEFFAELSTVDIYLYYKVTSKEVKLSDITSFSLGVHLLR